MNFKKTEISAKQKKAITFALKTIQKSELLPYIDKVILYGSCARGSEKWNSDVDLCIILKQESKQLPDLSTKIHLLKGTVSSDQIDAAEADAKFFIGNEWGLNQSAFCKNIRKDGKIIWQSITHH